MQLMLGGGKLRLSPFFGVATMKPSIQLIIVAAVALCDPSQANAQWFPNPGLSAMNSSIQRDASVAQVRSLSSSISREVANFSPRNLSGNNNVTVSTKLGFTSSQARRKQNLAKFVEKSRQSDPSGADQMAQLFASTDIIGAIGQGIAPFGLRVDNVADAYAVYWTNAWLGSRGRNETLTKQQISAVRNQAANALLATNEFTSATDAEKQEMAEAMLVQAALIEASVDNAKSDPALMTKVKAAIAQGANAMGLDLYTMTLTPNGFVPAKKGSAVDDAVLPSVGEDAQALASKTQSDDAPSYALIAAAGGAGLGGMFLLGRVMGRKS